MSQESGSINELQFINVQVGWMSCVGYALSGGPLGLFGWIEHHIVGEATFAGSGIIIGCACERGNVSGGT